MDKNNQSVKLTNLTKRYKGGKLAVENLNLTIFKDQISVLLGHNGAGKTTTISMINGIIEKTAGDCTIFGLDIDTHREEIQKMIGVCP